MTSKEDYQVPSAIEPEVAQDMTGGVMKVEAPTLKESCLGDKDKTGVFQLWCHSPRIRNNSLGLCNHSLGAILANTTGHSVTTMLLECPKCRTAYAITVELDEKEPAKLISSKVVNLNRGVQPFVDMSLDSSKDLWIQVHEKKS